MEKENLDVDMGSEKVTEYIRTISCKEDSSGGVTYSQNNNTFYPRCSGELSVRFLSSAKRKHRRHRQCFKNQPRIHLCEKTSK